MIRSWFKIGVRGTLSVQCFTRKKGQPPLLCSLPNNKPEQTTAVFLWKINFQVELKHRVCVRHPVSYTRDGQSGGPVFSSLFLQVVCYHGNPAGCCAVPVQVWICAVGCSAKRGKRSMHLCSMPHLYTLHSSGSAEHKFLHKFWEEYYKTCNEQLDLCFNSANPE